MHRIDGPGATVDNKFTEGDPVSAVPATEVTGDWLNAVQEEIAAVIVSAGLTLNKANNAQLLAAITQKITNAIPVSPPDASTTVKGIVELATDLEVSGGADDARAITPLKLKNKTQSSSYDASAGKLMLAGAFGVGSTYANPPTIPTDLNGAQVTGSGIYRYNTSSGGRPTFGTGYGSIDHRSMAQDGAGDYATQLAIDYTSNSIGFRRLAGASGWQPWFEIFHSGNLAQSTEAAPGIAALATQVKTNAVTDDLTIVTPKKLGNGFSMLKAANGYLILPSWLGGFILQWGVTTSGQTAVTFPVPFPSLCATVLPIGNNTTVVNIPTAKTATGFTLNSGTSGGTYFAIGY